jgi:hypothetical protein
MPKWYYEKTGRTYGPWALDGIKRLLAAGSLRGEDLIWADDADPKSARAVNEVLAASQPPTPTAAPGLPDWLRDVAELPNGGPAPPPAAKDRVPDWVDDVRELQESGDMASPTCSDIERWALDFPPPRIRRSDTEPVQTSTNEEAHSDAFVFTDGALSVKQKRRRAILVGALTAVPFWIFVIGYLIYRYLHRH